MSASVVTVVGNPRAESRTHGIARTLAAEVARTRGGGVVEVDLASLAPQLFTDGDGSIATALEQVLSADVLVVASPTYKATYTGLLKSFLDRIATGALTGTPAVPVLLGGAPQHALAVDVHFTPLLLELGASVPLRGLFVLESELGSFPAAAAAWAESAAPRLSRPAAPDGTRSQV
jgi:FMN reductase